MPLQTAMQGGAAEVWDGLAQADQDIIERQQRPTSELDHNCLLGQRQDRAQVRLRPHRRIARDRPTAPFGDRLRIQVVPGGQGAATLLRRLELGSFFDRLRIGHAALGGRCREELLLQDILQPLQMPTFCLDV